MTLEEARKNTGRAVVYAPIGGVPETGAITSTSATHVFVLYDGEQTPKATSAEDLTLLEEHVRATLEAADFPIAEPFGIVSLSDLGIDGDGRRRSRG